MINLYHQLINSENLIKLSFMLKGCTYSYNFKNNIKKGVHILAYGRIRYDQIKGLAILLPQNGGSSGVFFVIVPTKLCWMLWREMGWDVVVGHYIFSPFEVGPERMTICFGGGHALKVKVA